MKTEEDLRLAAVVFGDKGIEAAMGGRPDLSAKALWSINLLAWQADARPIPWLDEAVAELRATAEAERAAAVAEGFPAAATIDTGTIVVEAFAMRSNEALGAKLAAVAERLLRGGQ